MATALEGGRGEGRTTPPVVYRTSRVQMSIFHSASGFARFLGTWDLFTPLFLHTHILSFALL